MAGATVPAPFMAGEPVKTFVGREKDLEELHQIMVNRKVCAVTGAVGTDGIGKTDLVRMYAKRYKAEYLAGVFWASLKGRTWQQEAQRILKELYPEAEIVPLFDNAKAKGEILRHLNQKKALLVIDNVNEASEIIRPDCSVLVTTRDKKAFGIISRVAIKELNGLSRDDGIKLLAGVLGQDRVARDLSGASRVVELLDGMPLALHIAAHHLKAVPDLSFADYISQIQGKIKELKVKDSENKAVIASLELSLGQLESSPCGANYLAPFEAASICAESGFMALTLMETADIGELDQAVMEELCRRSLLEFDQNSFRYSMHPLLRQLSAAKVSVDEGKEFLYKQNHCMHFLRFAKSNANSPNMLISEKDGLWQAMAQARQIGREKELLPRFSEYLIQPFHQTVAIHDYEEAFRYLVATDLINTNNRGLVSNLDSALQILAQNQNDLQGPSRAWVYANLGNISIRIGEYDNAIDFYEKALEIYRLIGDVPGEGNVLGNMGDVSIRLGEYEKAINFYEKALAIYRKAGDATGEGKLLGQIGTLCFDLVEYRKAIGCYEKQLEITRLIGALQGEGNALGNMGLAYAELGEYRRAISFYEKQLEITRRATDTHGEGNTLGNLGIAYSALGEHAKAVDFYKKQLELHQRIGYVLGEGNALGNMGLAYAKMGMHEEAHRCFQASSIIFHGLGLPDVVARIEEMIRNAERWILKSVGLEWGKWTPSAFPGKKTLNKKLKS